MECHPHGRGFGGAVLQDGVDGKVLGVGLGGQVVQSPLQLREPGAQDVQFLFPQHQAQRCNLVFPLVAHQVCALVLL